MGEITLDLGLAGKTAVITGASSGIGFATAEAFLREGARVAVCARDPEKLEAAVLRLQTLGEVFGLRADAADAQSLQTFADSAAGRFGGIDCWVNNVGASIPRAGGVYTPEEIAATEAVCFHSAVYGCQAAFRYMKPGGGGAIVNVSSLAARCGTAGRSTLYGPLKAAVRELSVMFAAEYAAWHIRVNAVLPGFTETPKVARTIAPEELSKRTAGTLLRRMADPREIAEPIVFLCSGRASFITAAALEVSGGNCVVLNPEYSYEMQREGW